MINRHVILTSGRSGSNYLSNVLNLHPQIVNYGEVLASMIVPYKLFNKCKWCPWTKEQYLEGFYSSRMVFYAAQLYSAYSHLRKHKPINFKWRGRVKTIGTKDFFLNVKTKQVEKFYLSQPDLAVIYLYRENLLRRYLSGVFLRNTKIAATEAKVSIEKVTIDIGQMMNYLENLEKELAYEKTFLTELTQQHRVFQLRYEDYFASEASILSFNRQLFEFLGVEPMEAQSRHQKILPQAICDIVANYDEFCATLANTKYQQYLD